MEHYIKSVTGVKYNKTHVFSNDTSEVELYANPFDEYKEWDFFGIIFLPFYRTKIAKERLWKRKHHSMPDKYEIYTVEELRKYFHIKADDFGCLESQASLEITLSDGTKETLYFDYDYEAEKKLSELIRDYDLKLYKKEK